MVAASGATSARSCSTCRSSAREAGAEAQVPQRLAGSKQRHRRVGRIGGGRAPSDGEAAAPEGRPSVRQEPKVGRNDPCPCGSGKKYKKCHGA